MQHDLYMGFKYFVKYMDAIAGKNKDQGCRHSIRVFRNLQKRRHFVSDRKVHWVNSELGQCQILLCVLVRVVLEMSIGPC